MTLGTIIMIVLGIVVLVFLIFGFSTGWGNLWDRIKNVGPGESNLDSIRTGCEVACLSRSVDDYCYSVREVNLGGDSFRATCQQLASGTSLVPGETNCQDYYGARWRSGNDCQEGEVNVDGIKNEKEGYVCCVNEDDKANTEALISQLNSEIDSCPGLCS